MTPPTKNEKTTSQSQSQTGGNKKKRKKTTIDVVDTDAAGSEMGEKEKRTKTGRACDACRTKKIRCDILTSTSPNVSETPICAHCKQYNLECTFFLPITETRFKKRRMTEEHTSDSPHPRGRGETGSPAESRRSEVQARVEGPTSLSFLLHTTIPATASEAYDLRNHTSWEVTEDGDGLIRVNAPPTVSDTTEADLGDPTKHHNKLNKPLLSAHTISLLVNAYFDSLSPLFPIITRTEFAAKTSPSPLLLYAICGLGATRRQFPREVFAGVRGVINGLLRSNDILSDARLENVQALLLSAQVGDLHAQPTAATASAALIRTGTATRMAQDMGLHRESTQRAQTAQDLAFVELRRRVWAACVILDRWYGAALGIPLLVDLLDCDVLLPAPYDIIPEAEPSSWPIEKSYIGLAEHLKLSILIGRVLKTIYSPTGLKLTTDEQLRGLLSDMESWKENLPQELRFHGSSSSHIVGLLHMGYCALQFLFWRVFIRITHILPPHIKIGVEVERWSQTTQMASEAIEWLSHNDDALDSLFIFPYAATSCALIQYHTWARRRDSSALEMLKLIKETAHNWEKVVQPDQMSIRRKTCETMTLLYEAALKTRQEGPEPDRPPLNPTAGVAPRPTYGRARWVHDSSRPGGGFWLARDESERKDAGIALDKDIVVQQSGDSENQAEGSTTGQQTSERRDEHMELLQSMQTAANNLNPQMNLETYAQFPSGPGAGNEVSCYISLLSFIPCINPR
ncbi:hypothetical protein TREMEDRAFT_35093 [Tremella mesenterica DSM 1558]|uniref:uncharacterized protein n=1 Tax=Tremella mesenterica (strain ATCC 24925 / CBS 8224 / DSM 1558 / NBRC 9311 / NRRL Y-6157 / RJB 2259-6 / UBC 559-6) TaxID=578456 RepID=UPI00032CA035|nr:uncharacterized protein TREMEDRAFT_35093 [Tremella mesenterica DSM 1558]EIW66297.1 hypothetical protein TREMEDRAFT_35093 [Tremella mesenterica DSM 1558]